MMTTKAATSAALLLQLLRSPLFACGAHAGGGLGRVDGGRDADGHERRGRLTPRRYVAGPRGGGRYRNDKNGVDGDRPRGQRPNGRPGKRPRPKKKKPNKRPNGGGRIKVKDKGEKEPGREKDTGKKKYKKEKKGKDNNEKADKSEGNKDKGNNKDKDNERPSSGGAPRPAPASPDSARTKRHKLVGYWHNFHNGSGCPFRLAEISDAWGVVDIAFADNDRSADGTVHFNLYSGGDGCPALDPGEFKRDMARLQAKGKVFVLSLGGAEGTITLETDRDEANFVSSLTEEVLDWGFDGVDVDLESGSGIVVGSQIQKRLGRALLQVERNLGRDMYLTMAPEHPYVHEALVAYDGPWGAYIPVIEETRGTLDLLHVQLYNNGGLTNPYTAGAAGEGTVDMMVTHAKMLVEGFRLANGDAFEPLRDDQVAIGLPSGPSSAFSGQAPTVNVLDALDCLTRRRNCGSVKPSFDYANFGGVMSWSVNWDRHDGYIFSGPVGEKLEDMNSRRP